MPSYAQWFTNAVADAAKDAWTRLMREQGAGALYLYYKPHGLEFKVIREDEDAKGYELVMSERIPSNLTEQQIAMLFSKNCGRVPVLPVK